MPPPPSPQSGFIPCSCHSNGRAVTTILMKLDPAKDTPSGQRKQGLTGGGSIFVSPAGGIMGRLKSCVASGRHFLDTQPCPVMRTRYWVPEDAQHGTPVSRQDPDASLHAGKPRPSLGLVKAPWEPRTLHAVMREFTRGPADTSAAVFAHCRRRGHIRQSQASCRSRHMTSWAALPRSNDLIFGERSGTENVSSKTTGNRNAWLISVRRCIFVDCRDGSLGKSWRGAPALHLVARRAARPGKKARTHFAAASRPGRD